MVPLHGLEPGSGRPSLLSAPCCTAGALQGGPLLRSGQFTCQALLTPLEALIPSLCSRLRSSFLLRDDTLSSQLYACLWLLPWLPPFHETLHPRTSIRSHIILLHFLLDSCHLLIPFLPLFEFCGGSACPPLGLELLESCCLVCLFLGITMVQGV